MNKKIQEMNSSKPTYEELQSRIKELENAERSVNKLEWMLKPKLHKPRLSVPEYGDLSELNHQGLILQNVGRDILTDIVRDYLDLLDTSAAVYEANGDYALGIFSSDWCNLLDTSSRNICGKCSNTEALASGKWLCHESCWTEASKTAIETGEPADIECNGGLHIYALPIKLKKQIIGAINFGYGSPPTDVPTLENIGKKYHLSLEELTENAAQYETRPTFIIDIAKERLSQSARMISEIVALRLAEKKIQYQNEEIKSQNEELSTQNEEIKSINQSLLKSEEKYRSYINNAPHGVFVIDEKGNYLDANPAAERMTGYSTAEILQMNIADFSIDKDARKLAAERLALIERAGKMTVKLPYRKKGGNPGWWQIDAVKISPSKIMGFHTDITIQKNAEDALLLSESKYRQLVETASDAIYLISNTGKILDVNNASCQMLGHSKQEFQELLISDVDPNFHVDNFIEFWKHIPFFKQTIFETTHKTKDGREIPVEVNGNKFRIGSEVFFYGITRDITERKQSQQNLIRAKEKAEESEHKIRSMFENTLTGILFCDTQGNILEANPAVLKIMGSPSLEVSKKINLITFKPLQEIGFSQNIQKCLKENIVISEEAKYTSAYGKTVFIKYSLVPILVNKNPIGVWANLNDLTDLWQTKNDLQVAKEHAEESDRLKSAFLANMSHEIRTPMNGILGFADLLKEPDLTGDEQKKYVGIIEKSGERMLNIINDLIDISKIEAGQMEVIVSEANINEQIDFLYTFFKPEAELSNLELSFAKALPDQMAAIITDKEKLYAILTNLLKNAIKYTSAGSIDFGYTKKEDEIEFFIKDTGLGISKNRQQAIFERFVQADLNIAKPYEGAGLGLAITKAYVEMLGGKIWLESELGKGSVFYFTLPYQTKTAELTVNEPMVSVKKAEEILASLNVLIAEDDEIAYYYLEELLAGKCRSFMRAETGVEAIHLCRDNPEIDLILMDIKMPVMDGYEATVKIREFNKDVKIIAQTAYALSGDREKSIDAGCNDYITKPLKKQVLLNIIDKWM